MRLRLVSSGALPGALNMGTDEAVLSAVAEGSSPPTLRLYRWSPPCVTIGYFQSMDAEVDLAACKAARVDAVRRLTGGGAVYHDEEITYSLVVPLGHPLAPEDVLESYRLVCDGIVAGLGLLGAKASFAPINDIAVGGKKISGNAQTRRRGCLLQHGTVLIGLDSARMFSLLKVPGEKLRGRPKAGPEAGAEARVTSLRSVLGRTVEFDEAARALAEGCSKAWDAELMPDRLTPAETAAAKEFGRTRFNTDAWNLRR
jgi:lipoate---protein ligase